MIELPGAFFANKEQYMMKKNYFPWVFLSLFFINTGISFSQSNSRVFFHWSHPGANQTLLDISGYNGSRNGRLSQDVLDKLYQWDIEQDNILGGDAAGPGLYISSDPVDSAGFGASLMIVESEGARNFPKNPEIYQIAITNIPLKKWSEIPLATSYAETWNVISRAPLPGESVSFKMRFPTEADVAITWEQILENEKHLVLKTMGTMGAAILADLNPPLTPPAGSLVWSAGSSKKTDSARIFLHRIFFDSFLPWILNYENWKDVPITLPVPQDPGWTGGWANVTETFLDYLINIFDPLDAILKKNDPRKLSILQLIFQYIEKNMGEIKSFPVKFYNLIFLMMENMDEATREKAQKLLDRPVDIKNMFESSGKKINNIVDSFVKVQTVMSPEARESWLSQIRKIIEQTPLDIVTSGPAVGTILPYATPTLKTIQVLRQEALSGWDNGLEKLLIFVLRSTEEVFSGWGMTPDLPPQRHLGLAYIIDEILKEKDGEPLKILKDLLATMKRDEDALDIIIFSARILLDRDPGLTSKDVLDQLTLGYVFPESGNDQPKLPVNEIVHIGTDTNQSQRNAILSDIAVRDGKPRIHGRTLLRTIAERFPATRSAALAVISNFIGAVTPVKTPYDVGALGIEMYLGKNQEFLREIIENIARTACSSLSWGGGNPGDPLAPPSVDENCLKEKRQIVYRAFQPVSGSMAYSDIARIFTLVDPILVSEDVRNGANQPWLRYNESYRQNGQMNQQPVWNNFLYGWMSLVGMVTSNEIVSLMYFAENINAIHLNGFVDGTNTSVTNFNLINWDRNKYDTTVTSAEWQAFVQKGEPAELMRFFNIDSSRDPISMRFKSVDDLEKYFPDIKKSDFWGSSPMPGQDPSDVTKILGVIRRDRDNKVMDTIHRAAHLLHYMTKLHPFQNGNGRTGRLIATMELVLSGYDIPIGLPTNDFLMDEEEMYWEVRKALALGKIWKKMLTDSAVGQIPSDQFFQKVFKGSGLEALLLVQTGSREGTKQFALFLEQTGRVPAWAVDFGKEASRVIESMRARGGVAKISESRRTYELAQVWGKFAKERGISFSSFKELGCADILLQEQGN